MAEIHEAETPGRNPIKDLFYKTLYKVFWEQTIGKTWNECCAEYQARQTAPMTSEEIYEAVLHQQEKSHV